jgi:uncharacterized Zn-binding protein involved in type VI secretion
MPGWARLFDRSQCHNDGAVGLAAVEQIEVKPKNDVLVNGRPPLAMSGYGTYILCCGTPLARWTVREGSATVFVGGVHAAAQGYATVHQSGTGTLIEGSPDVLIGGPRITMEELARADALEMLDKGEAALKRWNAADKQYFKDWFGTDEEWARQTMLERTRDLRDEIKQADFEQYDDDAYAHTWWFWSPIYLEGKFWKSPRTGHNSRAGTVIHEASHRWGPGPTNDSAYGTTDAKALNRRLPLGLGNADNNEYYFEHLP